MGFLFVHLSELATLNWMGLSKATLADIFGVGCKVQPGSCCMHMVRWVHNMELTPTPLWKTVHGKSPGFLITSIPRSDVMDFVFLHKRKWATRLIKKIHLPLFMWQGFMIILLEIDTFTRVRGV